MLDLHTDEHDKYIRALRALEKAGKQSDQHAIATSSQEIQFMKEVNAEVGKLTFGAVPYKPGQYENIFKKR